MGIRRRRGLVLSRAYWQNHCDCVRPSEAERRLDHHVSRSLRRLDTFYPRQLETTEAEADNWRVIEAAGPNRTAGFDPGGPTFLGAVKVGCGAGRAVPNAKLSDREGSTTVLCDRGPGLKRNAQTP